MIKITQDVTWIQKEGESVTKLLIKLFIKEKENVTDAKVRTAYGNLAGIVGIICNVLLFAGKYLVGTIFGSIAIAADAINNLSDASSNIVSLLGFKLGSRKPDAEHPYGHGRYEYLAGLVVCVIILAIGLSLAKESVGKIIHPTEVAFSWLSIIVLIVSVAVKLWMSLFNRAIGIKINSDTLMATAADSRNDVISTAVVIVSTFLCKATGIYRIDGIMGLGVAVFILYSGVMLIRETLSPLLGKAPDREFVKNIEKKVREFPDVIGVHDLMVHDYGPGNIFATLHVEFPAETDVIKAHDVIDNIEKYFLTEENLMMTIHYDPIVTSDERVNELWRFLSQTAKELDERLSIHDVRLVPGNTHINLVFDCVKPAGFEKPDKEIRSYIEKKVKSLDEKYQCVIKMEQSYV